MPISIKDIDSEIRSGLENERKRLNCAMKDLAYYRGDFEQYETRLPADRYDDHRSDRESFLMNRIVTTLTQNLYKVPPARAIPNFPDATKFLHSVYKDNHMFAKWQEADRLSLVGEVAAFQVAGTDDPKHPVKIHLWDASQFTIWTAPDDPLTPIAVVTIDMYDEQRRYTLYTETEIRTYITKKIAPTQTSGGTAAELISKRENPFNFIPFCFTHFQYPTTNFWSGGPGSYLRHVNQYINSRLTDAGDAIRYMGKPIGVAEGMPASWEPKKGLLPGDFISLPPSMIDAADNAVKPNLKYLNPDLGFVQAFIDDLNFYINHTLECAGIPETSIRFVTSAGRSGVSIVTEQLPLLIWAKGRQPQFHQYEEDLARLVLMVASSHYRSNDATPPPQLEEALEDFELSLRFADFYPDIPGPERDRAEEWLLNMGLLSRIQILMRRNHCTREEAIQELREIEADKEVETTIIGPAPNEAIPTPTGEGLDGDETDDIATQEQDEEEDDGTEG